MNELPLCETSKNPDVLHVVQHIGPWEIFKLFQNYNFLNHFHRLNSWALLVKLLSGACHITPAHNPLDESILVQVMVWCRNKKKYLSQCWPRSTLPYGLTMPQWVDICVYILNTFLLCAYINDISIHAWFSWSIINWYLSHADDLALFHQHQILLKVSWVHFPELMFIYVCIFVVVVVSF